MKHPHFASSVASIVVALATAATAAPLAVRTVEGPAEGPLVRFIIERAERDKTIGIDKQLAGFALKGGRLIIETHDPQKPVEPGDLDGVTPDFEVRLQWADELPGLEFTSLERPAHEVPVIRGNRPEKTAAWFRDAIGDSLDADDLAKLAVASDGAADGAATAVIRYVTSQRGAPGSRQFRFTRKFAANLLADLGMIEPHDGFWPPNLDVSNLVCIYDAEGCGYNGPVRLERVIDRTSLDFQTVFLCGEDIRDGALDGARVVIFPGGTAGGIRDAVGPDALEIMRKFVAQGGGYVGVCAGAYLAGSGHSGYLRLHHLVQDQPWAKGSGMIDLELTDAGIELLGTEFRVIKSRYNNGPVFLTNPAPPADALNGPVVILSNYLEPAKTRRGRVADEMVGTPAIVANTYGDGRVLNISPHPETHEEFDVMVARCIGWAAGVPRDAIHLRTDP